MNIKKSELVIGSLYEHYKGKRYKVHGVVRHSETLEELVYKDGVLKVQIPRSAEVKPRQIKIGESISVSPSPGAEKTLAGTGKNTGRVNVA